MGDSYEIHIDESGEFGDFVKKGKKDTNYKPIRLVGGVVVPNSLKASESEITKEMIELGRYYMKSCEKVTDIHLSDTSKLKPGKSQDDLRAALMTLFNESMPGIKIAFVYNLDELPPDSNENAQGPRLYRNILLKCLNTLLYYHPFFGKEDSFEVKIAHRRVEYRDWLAKGLPGKGYLRIKERNGLTQFSAITEAEVDSIMEQLMSYQRASISFFSKRRTDYSVMPYHKYNSPFMVMADFVCNTVFKIIKENWPDKNIHRNLLKHFKMDQLLFYCSSDFDLPESLLAKYFHGKYDEFISSVLEYNNGSSTQLMQPIHILFRPALLNAINKIKGNPDPIRYKNLIGLADKFLNNKDFYKLDDVNGLILLVKDRLDKVAGETANKDWDLTAYQYHDVCLRYFNHTGDTVNGVIHADKGTMIFDRMSIKDLNSVRAYNEFINRASVTDSNEFAFQRAIKRLEPIQEKEETVSNLYGSVRNVVLGKIHGSLGQNFAFLQNYSEAKHHFERSGIHLGWDDTMQTSYRAHLAIDQNNWENYEKEICRLLGVDGFSGFGQLVDLCFKNIQNNEFNLHLLMKGMLSFPDRLKDQNIIDELLNQMNPLRSKVGNHPWELSFICMGRLLEKINKGNFALTFWENAANFNRSDAQWTFVMIGHSARAWAARHLLNQSEEVEARKWLQPVLDTFLKISQRTDTRGIFNPNNVADADGIVRKGWFDEVGAKFISSFESVDGSTLNLLCKELIDRFTFNYW